MPATVSPVATPAASLPTQDIPAASQLPPAHTPAVASQLPAAACVATPVATLPHRPSRQTSHLAAPARCRRLNCGGP